MVHPKKPLKKPFKTIKLILNDQKKKKKISIKKNPVKLKNIMKKKQEMRNQLGKKHQKLKTLKKVKKIKNCQNKQKETRNEPRKRLKGQVKMKN
jgi:hypothetical protein